MALDTTIGGTASDSYVTLAEYEAYVASQGLTPLSGNDASHEAELRRAAVVIDDSYSFIGLKQYQFQARAWPRLVRQLVDDWPIDPDTIPDAIKRAQMEMAWLIHTGVDPFATYNGAIKRERVKVDVIEEETEYTGGKGRPAFTGVERILRPYLSAGPGMARVVRG